MSAIEVVDLSRHYRLGSVEVPALRGVSLRIAANAFTVLSGPSGSGKSTLLNLLGGLDRPDSGHVVVAGQRLDTLDDNRLSDFRARHIGFVFQHFNLLPVLTARENVEYPLLLAGVAASERRRRAAELLDAVGLAERAANLPGQLSGGQRQRVAIARALALRPALVLADEPTANLDSHTGAAIIALMRDMQRQYQTCFVFSSHDAQLLAAADHAVLLRDGQLQAPAAVKEAA